MNKKVTGKVRNSLETYESALSCSAGECRGLDQDQIKAIVQLQVRNWVHAPLYNQVNSDSFSPDEQACK